MEKILVRQFTPEIRKKSEETRTITFVASDGSRDSAHTRINPKGWDLSRFEKNPIIGYNHDVYGGWGGDDPDKVIGKGHAYVEGEELLVDITFEPKEINPKAEKVFQKLMWGSLSAVSVGFLAGEGEWGKGEEGPGKKNETYYYTQGHQLLEVSVVNIPANGNATKKGEDGVEDELKELRAAVEAEVKKALEPVLEAKKLAEEKALQDDIDLTMAAAEAALSITQ